MMDPGRPLTVSTVDYHTGGEPFRIVSGGVGPLQGDTILAKRRYAAEHLDHVRRLLVYEPRGHADMYGCFVTEPEDPGGDLGVVFFHNAGYSTACGHGTIALVTWALESGVLRSSSPGTRVVVDAPSGRLETMAAVAGDRVTSVRFRNVPSFVHTRDVKVEIDGAAIACDIAYGGAFYASVEASRLGLTVAPRDLGAFIELGRKIKASIETSQDIVHPEHADIRDVYGVIFFEHLGRESGALHQRNVTVFADGEVDRSPCGSGTSARLALLDAQGDLARGETLLHDGIVGTRFVSRVVDDGHVGGRPAVITEVEGSAHLAGYSTFVLRPDDPVGTGFLLR